MPYVNTPSRSTSTDPHLIFILRSVNQSSDNISLKSISAKSSFKFLRPAVFFIEPVAAEELADAGIIWLFLWRFKRDEAVEVLVDQGWIARAAMG